MPTYLDEIVAHHRARAAADSRSLAELERAAAAVPPPRPFVSALGVSEAPIAVIAEIKRRSPSRGDLAPNLDPAQLAIAYAEGGAACLSVLTDQRFFGGSAQDLTAARAACKLPVLRKDFTVCAADLYDARSMGADAVLLIVAALTDAELAQFVELAQRLGLAALVEIHDGAELERALVADATLIGVNQRDLHTFEVDPRRALALRESIPASLACVAESGIRTGDDLARLAAAGFDGALIGESLVTAGEPTAVLRGLLATAAAEKVS